MARASMEGSDHLHAPAIRAKLSDFDNMYRPRRLTTDDLVSEALNMARDQPAGELRAATGRSLSW